MPILLRGEKHPPRDELEGIAPEQQARTPEGELSFPPGVESRPLLYEKDLQDLARPHSRGLPTTRAAPESND